MTNIGKINVPHQHIHTQEPKEKPVVCESCHNDDDTPKKQMNLNESPEAVLGRVSVKKAPYKMDETLIVADVLAFQDMFEDVCNFASGYAYGLQQAGYSEEAAIDKAAQTAACLICPEE